MNLQKASSTLALAMLAVLFGPQARAQQPGFYAGGSVGKTYATIDDARITGGLAAAGFATTSVSDRDRDTGYKLFAGYQFHPNFAIEGGYFDLGKFGYTATTVPAGTLRGDIRLNGVHLDLLGILPVTEQFSVFGRVGANYARARDTFAGTGAVAVVNPNPSKRDTNYKIGAGVLYNFSPVLAVRAEVERYRINDAVGNKGHVDMFSLGLLYRFSGI